MVNWILRRCTTCKKYTMCQDRCPYCGGKVQIPHPAKFSPDDKYLRHRSLLKRE